MLSLAAVMLNLLTVALDCKLELDPASLAGCYVINTMML